MLLHVGDFDPSGVSIFESISADAAAFLEEDKIINTLKIIPVRVALTAEQVKMYALPTAPAKTSDSRSGRWTGETCQLEALPPDTLAEIVKREIEKRLDLDLLEDQIRRESADKIDLRRALPRST